MAQVHVVLVRPRGRRTSARWPGWSRTPGSPGCAWSNPETGAPSKRSGWPGRRKKCSRTRRYSRPWPKPSAVAGWWPDSAAAAREVIQHLTPRELAGEIGGIEAAGEVAVVFGNESSGLTLEERKLCQRQVRIPASPRPALAEPGPGGDDRGLRDLRRGQSASRGTDPSSDGGRVRARPRHLRDAMLSVGFLPPRNRNRASPSGGNSSDAPDSPNARHGC